MGNVRVPKIKTKERYSDHSCIQTSEKVYGVHWEALSKLLLVCESVETTQYDDVMRVSLAQVLLITSRKNTTHLRKTSSPLIGIHQVWDQLRDISVGNGWGSISDKIGSFFFVTRPHQVFSPLGFISVCTVGYCPGRKMGRT